MLRNLKRFRPAFVNFAFIARETVKSKPKDINRVCRVLNIRCCHNEKSSSQNNSNKHSNENSEEELITDDDIKAHILEESLNFVPTYGWSIDALSEGAKAVGYPGVAHGMFQRAGGDLMLYFVASCNRRLAKQLAEGKKHLEDDPELPKKKTSQVIRDSVEARLRMIIPYIDHWPQAMALTALPSVTLEHFKNLSTLMDDIWFYAGDRSTDMNWYTKRLTLLALYKSTEIHLIQDKSPDFEETWKFLDNRTSDLNNFSKATASLDALVTGFSDLASAAFTVGRNVAGINNTKR